MSAENQSRIPDVQITYHADGSATVNDVPVSAESGQSVRDTAYQVAVALVVAAGASEPVGATSVEPDGAAYPITLYPLKAVAAGASAIVGAAAAFGTSDHSRKAAGGAAASTGEAVGGSGAGAGSGVDNASGFQGQYRRARRAWYRPRLSVSWLVAGACASVLLSVLATVLLQANNPSFARLSVDTENAVSHSAPEHEIGQAVASIRDIVPGPSPKTTKIASPTAQKTPQRPPTGSPNAQSAGQPSSTGAQNNGTDGSANDETDGLPQPSHTVPRPAPGPKPKPAPGNPGKPATVTDLAVALVGGDKSDEIMAYVITVSTSNASPVTLTYTYAGAKGAAPARRSVVLSGQTSYALADLIPAQPYCGAPVNMTAASTPAASNGTVTATAQPGC